MANKVKDGNGPLEEQGSLWEPVPCSLGSYPEGQVDVPCNAHELSPQRITLFLTLYPVGAVSSQNVNIFFSKQHVSESFTVKWPFFFSLFFGLHLWHMEVPRLGVKSYQSYSCRPMPQPQQHQIRAVSAAYTTAYGNARSLTHWARPGIEPASSWILVRFISAEPQRELLKWLLWNVERFHENGVLITLGSNADHVLLSCCDSWETLV